MNVVAAGAPRVLFCPVIGAPLVGLLWAAEESQENRLVAFIKKLKLWYG